MHVSFQGLPFYRTVSRLNLFGWWVRLVGAGILADYLQISHSLPTPVANTSRGRFGTHGWVAKDVSFGVIADFVQRHARCALQSDFQQYKRSVVESFHKGEQHEATKDR